MKKNVPIKSPNLSTGQDEGILELATTPIAFIQPTNLVAPATVRLSAGASLMNLVESIAQNILKLFIRFQKITHFLKLQPIIRISVDNVLANGAQDSVVESETSILATETNNLQTIRENAPVKSNDDAAFSKDEEILRLARHEEILDGQLIETAELPKLSTKRSPGRPRKDAASAASNVRFERIFQSIKNSCWLWEFIFFHSEEKLQRIPQLCWK